MPEQKKTVIGDLKVCHDAKIVDKLKVEGSACVKNLHVVKNICLEGSILPHSSIRVTMSAPQILTYPPNITVINFDKIESSSGDLRKAYDTVNKNFVVPRDGIYSFSISVLIIGEVRFSRPVGVKILNNKGSRISITDNMPHTILASYAGHSSVHHLKKNDVVIPVTQGLNEGAIAISLFTQAAVDPAAGFEIVLLR